MTRVRNIPFFLWTLSSARDTLSGVAAIWGTTRSILPEKTSPRCWSQVKRWQEAGFDTLTGCPSFRLGIFWKNKCLYQLSHYDFIFKILFICLFICLARHLSDVLIYAKCPLLFGKLLFVHQDSLNWGSFSTSSISLLQNSSQFACSGPSLVLLDKSRENQWSGRFLFTTVCTCWIKWIPMANSITQDSDFQLACCKNF